MKCQCFSPPARPDNPLTNTSDSTPSQQVHQNTHVTSFISLYTIYTTSEGAPPELTTTINTTSHTRYTTTQSLRLNLSYATSVSGDSPCCCTSCITVIVSTLPTQITYNQYSPGRWQYSPCRTWRHICPHTPSPPCSAQPPHTPQGCIYCDTSLACCYR